MTQTIDALISALRDMPEITPIRLNLEENILFTGSGDSLASGLVSSRKGGRVCSSGDIEWMEELPVNTEVLVGVSNSGTSGATIRALRRARECGVRTVAVTATEDSVMAKEANELQLIPQLDIDEQVPVAGHLTLSFGVASLSGYDVFGISRKLADTLDSLKPEIETSLTRLPANLPEAMTVLSLPELRSAGNFATLKFIEAVGIAARDVPLEESGHVDYFIGSQPHLVLSLRGKHGQNRFDRLERALQENGQTVVPIDFSKIAGDDEVQGDLLRELAAAVFVTFLAIGAAQRWERRPFRGGEVNMDASHIKIDIG